MEDEPCPTHARDPVHQCDLAEERCALVELELRADGIGSRGRADLDGLAVLEGQLEVLDHDARER